MKEYKVYGLKDPMDNVIKYIGVSTNVESRYKQHFYKSDLSGKSKWIERLKENNLRPELIILDTIKTDDRSVALNLEQKYIIEYKDRLYNKLGLSNVDIVKNEIWIKEENKSIRDILREEIIETSFYLTQSITAGNIEDIDRLRQHLNRIVELYKKELTTNVL
jgi:predicted GIY-YIG superfamily endonuclease